MTLNGKTALVTGAGRGIGRGIALRLAQDGAKVIVNYSRSAKAAEELVQQIKGEGGDALALGCDVSDLDAVKAMFAQLEKEVSRLDILVNNAGRGSSGTPTLSAMTPEDYDTVFALNTRSVFFVTQAALKLIPDYGRIINLSSTSSRCRVPGLSAYAGSKAATEAFTRIWAAELAPRQITVNAILPGIVDTDLIRDNLSPELAERSAKSVPLGRMGQPGDIADVVAFLASENSRWITGECISVAGGS